jgi:hypothetical protein
VLNSTGNGYKEGPGFNKANGGGSFGGQGGSCNNLFFFFVYGDVKWTYPNLEYGSGAWCQKDEYKRGGGAIFIQAGSKIKILGYLLANGEDAM